MRGRRFSGVTMQHNLETIYRKMSLNARVLPTEYAMVVKDMDKRLTQLEGKDSNGTKEPVADRRKPSKVSKKKVPTD